MVGPATYSQLPDQSIPLEDPTSSNLTPGSEPTAMSLKLFDKTKFLNCSLDWREPAGKCWEFWRMGRCCGTPPDFAPGCYCFWSWLCCFSCNLAKLFASSQGKQRCSIVNHWLLIFLLVTAMTYAMSAGFFVLWLLSWSCFTVVRAIQRFNFRLRGGFGQPSFEIADFLLPACCCGDSCDLLQQCRYVERNEWDCIQQLRINGGFSFFDPDCTVFYQPQSNALSIEESQNGQGNSLSSLSQQSQQPFDRPAAAETFAQPMYMSAQPQAAAAMYPMAMPAAQQFGIAGSQPQSQPFIFVQSPMLQPPSQQPPAVFLQPVAPQQQQQQTEPMPLDKLKQ